MAGRFGKQILGIFYYLSLNVFRKMTAQSWGLRVINTDMSGMEGDFSELHFTVQGMTGGDGAVGWVSNCMVSKCAS